MIVANLYNPPAVSVLRQEQYHTLLFCWKLRIGLQKGVEIKRIKRYADWFFSTNLAHHFDMEETFIFPLMNAESKLVRKALTDHRRLRRLFMNGEEALRSLSLLEEELESYILFERQRLTYEMQEDIEERKLDLIMRIYSESLSFDDWGDEFWN